MEEVGGDVPAVSAYGIFLSYRREDAAAYARLLQHEFRDGIPDARVFMDLDSIGAGLDFAEVIREAVESCAVLVALIGRQWATLADEEGHRRLDNPKDFVRFEIQTALEHGVRVIPVLVDGAKPPREQQLPPKLRKLARLSAAELSSGRYEYDKDQLLEQIQQVLADRQAREEADRQAREEADRQAREEADRQAREEADRQAKELAAHYALACELANSHDWDRAIEMFTLVVDVDPGYRDVQQRVEDARKQQQIARWQAEARRLHQARQWAAVVKAGQRLHALDPAADDPEGLVTSARAELAAAEEKAREEADRQAREEADRQAREEADRRLQELAAHYYAMKSKPAELAAAEEKRAQASQPKATRIRAPAVDVPALAWALRRWYENQDLEAIETATSSARTVQCRRRGMSTPALLTVILHSEGEDLVVEFGPAKWLGTAAAVLGTAYLPSVATTGLATWRRHKLMTQTISFLRETAPKYLRSAP